MHLVKLLSLGSWGLTWTFAPAVNATEPTLPFEVHAAGNQGCSPPAFVAKLTAASPRLRRARPGEAALDFSLRTVKTAEVFSGQLRVRELDGNETTRTISGATCDEVLSALALVAAVLIDSSANPRVATAPARAIEAPVVRRAADPSSGGYWRFGAGVGAGIETAVSPEVVPTVSLQLEGALLGRGAFSPRVALALHRSAGSTVETAA